jgi:predicted RNA-binding protein YlqC (UPF0109 family)
VSDPTTAVAVCEYLVRELVDDPDAVAVDTVDGRRGRMATAIRTVVRAAAAKDGTEVDVDFVD